jgi:Tfp pilus assembly PilM family ATPase
MFKNSHIGLDISDESIKFVELISTGSSIQLGRYGEHKIPTGTIESDKIKDTEQLKKILSSIRKEEGLKLTLPSVPTELNQEAQALVRAVIKKGDPETYMIVNVGDESASISIISNTKVIFFSTIDASGEILIEKLAKHFLYWHTHKDEQGKNHLPIAKIILVGENPNISGLSEHLSVKLRHPVELANVWINILDTQKNIPEMTFMQSLYFAVAIGLALENFK